MTSSLSFAEWHTGDRSASTIRTHAIADNSLFLIISVIVLVGFITFAHPLLSLLYFRILEDLLPAFRYRRLKKKTEVRQ